MHGASKKTAEFNGEKAVRTPMVSPIRHPAAQTPLHETEATNRDKATKRQTPKSSPHPDLPTYQKEKAKN